MPGEPHFITIEGGEGAGKSTLIHNLEDRLNKHGFQVSLTREPGGTPLAERIRSLLLKTDADSSSMSVHTEALLVSAARRNHVEQFIRPEIQKGHVVICDRFTDSTRAYQGSELSEDELGLLEAFATDGLRPGTTFLLDAPPDALVERRHQRGLETDRFEGRNLEFHNRVRNSFLRCAEMFPERIVVLNALLPPDELADTATSALLTRPGFTTGTPSLTQKL
ncbi:MAG: dTMP kinase [Ponticaulis sp.]|nr:dTMP kinase [Ponticaulis sp.]|tara:strand:+ start:1290 stop:1955 length:666 start_codon:yes stop_codon:yes gene_type:complete